MRKYKLIAKKGEGIHAEVLKAQNTKTSTFYAIKCMKSSYGSADEVNNLREIQAIKRLGPHPNIVKLEEVMFDLPSGRMALAFELMEGNLYELMCGREMHFSDATLNNLHSKGIFHRHIKPENILVSKDVKTLKLAGFGKVRDQSPETILTDGMYSSAVDLWGAGCVMFELLAFYPLFEGTSRADTMDKIHSALGSPGPEVLSELRKHASSTFGSFTSFPHQVGTGIEKLLPDECIPLSADCLNLLERCLVYDASQRITSKQAVSHPYFRGVSKQECQNGRLSQYRVAVLQRSSIDLAPPLGLGIIRVYEVAPTSKEEFETWWRSQIEQAKQDKVALLVLKPTHSTKTQAHKWLEKLEEDDWDGPDFSDVVKFITNKALKDSIASEEVALVDSWGDEVTVSDLSITKDYLRLINHQEGYRNGYEEMYM